jgi:hypothetical protein
MNNIDQFSEFKGRRGRTEYQPLLLFVNGEKVLIKSSPHCLIYLINSTLYANFEAFLKREKEAQRSLSDARVSHKWKT